MDDHSAPVSFLQKVMKIYGIIDLKFIKCLSPVGVHSYIQELFSGDLSTSRFSRFQIGIKVSMEL